MEVLVVDGASDDDTVAVVQDVAARSPHVPVTVLSNPKRIVPTGMNIALARAKGDVIVRVDGHCEIEPDYVRRCVEALASTGADNVGGLQRAVADGVVGRGIAAAMASPFGVGGARFHYATEPGWVDTVYLGAYPKTVFDRIGGFDEDLVRNQDDELNFRLQQAGGKIWLDPTIRSVYRPRSSLRALWRQYSGYGFYKVLVMRKRGGFASWRHLVPAAFVLGAAGCVIVGVVTGRWQIPVIYLSTYAAANLAASTVSGRGLGRSRFVLPLVFAILHVAYGIGFLRGLIRWGVRGPAR
jgi:glycosyltransferase involved in cell wall biosynthesis